MLVEIKKFGKEEQAICSSLDVAETFGKEHKEVLRALEGQASANGKTKHAGIIGQLEQGGYLPFENYFFPAEYVGENGRTYRQYFMTRDGFTLLAMGFSGEKALKFKVAYIKQFNAMEAALRGKLIEREKGIAVRQALTKALQQSTENERMHGHAYSNYTNCIYRVLFGKDASQLRKYFGISSKDNLRDCFSAEELAAVQSMERLISGLVDCGWGYDQVKSFIAENRTKALTA